MRQNILITALALSLAACSTSQNGAHDVRPRVPGDINLPGPAVSPEATPPVAVELRDADGNPLAGVPVVFSDDQGRALAQTMTSETGSAAVEIPAGGAVSVVRSSGTFHEVTSVAGLHPGITVGFGGRSSTVIGSVGVIFDSAMPGATYYEVDAGCGSNVVTDVSSPALLTPSNDCDAANITVLVLARDASWHAIGWSTADVALDPMQGYAEMTTPAWRTDFDDVTLTLANAPASTLMVQASVGIFHHGLRFADSYADATASAGSTSSFVEQVPAGFGDARAFDVAAVFGSGSVSVLEQQTPGTPASFSVDLAAQLLPQVSLTGVDAASGSITWTMPGMPAVDAIRVGAQWSDVNGSSWNWTAVAPSLDSAAHIPDLPSTLADAHPASNASLDGASVTAYDADYVTGFDTVASSADLFPAAPVGSSILRMSSSTW